MNHIPAESSLRFLTATELANERRGAVEDAKPKCTCPETIVIDGVEYMHLPGRGVVDQGCKLHRLSLRFITGGGVDLPAGDRRSVERIVGGWKGRERA